MTRSEESDTLQTFATFRVAGDLLVPDDVTRILRVPPTQAYSKGERYWGGPHSPALLGRTGIWYLSTDRLAASRRLDDHIGLLIGLLTAQRGDSLPLIQLNQLLKRDALKAHVSCYWFGRAGAKKPAISPIVTKLFRLLPADIETDFGTEEKSDGRRVA